MMHVTAQPLDRCGGVEPGPLQEQLLGEQGAVEGAAAGPTAGGGAATTREGAYRQLEAAADALARADKAWLGRLITRRVPLDRWSEALEYRHGDIKVIIDFVQ